MSIERMKMLKDNMMACVESQIMGGLEKVNAKELGEAVDIIKDFSEAIYYSTITDAMEDKDKEEARYYTRPYYRDMDRDYGKMYYQEPAMGSQHYTLPSEMHDIREGRSGYRRKYYMESKEMNHPHEKKMAELEKYMEELSRDITEMIEGASPEERQILQQKLNTLATKV